MKKKTILLSSLFSVLAATGLIVGATYSLFTSESTHNITIGSGTVNVVSEVDKPTMELYSMEERQGETFANGGTATISQGGTLKLTNLTPGDSIKFKVRIKNESNVAVKYKVSMSKENDELAKVLTFTGPTVDLWETLAPKSGEPYEGILTDFYEIKFPNSTEDQNALQELTTTVHIRVEAIQANAPQAQNYTIKFNSTYGTYGDLSYQPGQTIVMPEVSSETGHTFEGWYTTEDFKEGTLFEATEMPMKNVTLYAKWTTNKYTIQFEENGGSAVSDLTNVSYNSSIALPTPTLSGYTFAGWFKDNDTFAQQVNYTNMPAESLTLYAKWDINSYNLVFETNGGSITGNTSSTVQYNADLVLPTPTKTGYTFAYWCTTQDLSVKNTATTMPASDLTLYAKYNINSYNLILHTNGGTIEGETTRATEYNSVLDLPTPTKTGYTFDYWCTDDGLLTQNTITNMPAEALNLYAKYTINEVTLTFNSNGGSSVSSITQNYNTDISAPVEPLKTDLEFDGWYLDNNTFTQKFTFDKMPGNNTTIHAKWKEIDITNYDIGSSDFINYNEFKGFKGPNTKERIILPTSAEDSYEGGYVSPIESIGQSAFLNHTEVKEVILPTQLKEIGDDAFKGSGVSKITLPDSVTNIGANAFNSCTDLREIIIPKNVLEIRENCFANCDNLVVKVSNPDLLYANDYYEWIQGMGDNCRVINGTENFDDNNTYTITYNNEGSTESKQVIHGGKLTHPTYTRDGYKFAGWYLDSQFNTPLKTSFMPAGGTTVYAKWEPLIVNKTITFETNGATVSIPDLTAEVGSTITAPIPEKNDYWFKGWYSDPALQNPYELTTMPNENKTLYAKWEKDIYTYEEIDFGAAYYVLDVKDGERVASSPVLPTNHKGKPVIGVNGYSLLTSSWITEIDIPRGYTFLKRYCMQGNDNLKKVFIPNTVTDVETIILNNGNTKVFVEHSSRPGRWDPQWFGNQESKTIWGATHQDYLDYVPIN